MSVVGCDLSTRALDLVKLDDDGRAEWVRVPLEGGDAWARTLTLRWALLGTSFAGGTGWFDDVHLIVLEAPYGRGQAGTNALLNRVVGAVAASLPAHLRTPERCWIVSATEARAGLGLKANVKPTASTLTAIAPDFYWPVGKQFQEHAEHYYDAYVLALWASRELDRGTAAA